MYSIQGKAVRDFLAGEAPGPRQHYLQNVLAMSDDLLEWTHDIVQWLFPLTEKSSAQPSAPVLTMADLVLLGQDPGATAGTYRAWRRMLRFFGLNCENVNGTPEVAPAANFEERAAAWVRFNSHNDLRVSRMLRSMMLQGHTRDALALYTFLATLFNGMPDYRQNALRHWSLAIGAPAK